ncbi:MAG: VIT1/CCC1 transporter family protein [Candidatus Nitrosotenuis sp.]
MKPVEPRHMEPHLTESSGVRDFVFGFGDGINTSLGIAAGVGGADVSSNIIILASLVGMFTGAKAMAVQNYLAVKAQKELLRSEIAREEWEIENMPDEERKEIEEIYKAKGFSGEQLDMVVDKITSNKKVWLQTMLTEELQLNLEVVGNPLKSAFRMFGAFLLGGILPIIPFFFLHGHAPLLIAIGISLSSSFMVGAAKSKMAKTNIIKGGLEMAGLGTGIALVGFGIGTELANLGIIDF